jgi:ABC-type transport system substrate-binding protein
VSVIAGAVPTVPGEERSPAGVIHVVDPSPLNWLWITFNTMEEPVRAAPDGRLVPALAAAMRWLDGSTLELELRQDVRFQDGAPFTGGSVVRNWFEMIRWAAPHPPGTWLNFPWGTRLEPVNDQVVRLCFPCPDGLAPYKLRAFHQASLAFWRELGFGYTRTGSGEGHW